ncbi:endonuclease-reverse transcriptase [Elysia marginata]|uniref:Endonuclease-reverse transcriptase n=1 Tax=Elysia marginata TaxID=1093978 RepID=A0AAV4G3N9_9GAST|nr:endonuclease-reverse transcriptase [Elysia marginata]
MFSVTSYTEPRSFILKILEVFQNKCLRRILKIFWPKIISNKDLGGRSELEPLNTIIRERRWKWLGHVCRRPPESLIRRALRLDPCETKKQRTTKGCLEDDRGEGPERKRPPPKKRLPHLQRTDQDGELFNCLKRQTLRED